MAFYLLDTNILLRLVDPKSPGCAEILLSIDMRVTNFAVLYWVFTLSGILPAVPLVVGWNLVLRNAELRRLWQILPLVVCTVSFGWLIASGLSVSALGPYYSRLRFTIIYGNMACMFAAGVAVFFMKSRLRWPGGISAVLLFFAWLLMGAVNSVV